MGKTFTVYAPIIYLFQMIIISTQYVYTCVCTQSISMYHIYIYMHVSVCISIFEGEVLCLLMKLYAL